MTHLLKTSRIMNAALEYNTHCNTGAVQEKVFTKLQIFYINPLSSQVITLLVILFSPKVDAPEVDCGRLTDRTSTTLQG